MSVFKKLKNPVAIIILGRPGSGKDTQANFLASHYNLAHIKTSALLLDEFKKTTPSNGVMRREKIIFDSGQLNTPSWVMSVIKKKISSIKLDKNNGIIFSGSPRTLYEAENLLPFLENIFGKENVFGIYVDITEGEGIKRIIKRNERPLDRDVNILKIRMKEFEERTAPILNLFKERGILKNIDGMPASEIIFENIKKTLNL